jgi:hypothetical protein
MPVKPLDCEYAEKLTQLLLPGSCLFPIADDWLHFFTEKGLSYYYNDGDSDYVYTKEKLATYPGKKLHGKRNLLYQFTAKYSTTVLPLTSERINDALYVLDEWKKESTPRLMLAPVVKHACCLTNLICAAVYIMLTINRQHLLLAKQLP